MGLGACSCHSNIHINEDAPQVMAARWSLLQPDHGATCCRMLLTQSLHDTVRMRAGKPPNAGSLIRGTCPVDVWGIFDEPEPFMMTTDINSYLKPASAWAFMVRATAHHSLMSLWEDIPGFRNLGVSLVAQTSVTATILTQSEHW